MTFRWVYLVPVIVLAGLTWLFSQTMSSQPAEEASPLLGKPMPNVEVVALPGKTCGISPEAFKGKVTILTFFASWCGPCGFNHEMLKDLVKQQDVRLVGINFQDNPLNAQMWLMQKSDPYTCIGSDPQGQASVAWGVRGVPQLYIIDKQGVVRYSHLGILKPDTIEHKILPLLAQLKNDQE